MPRIVCQAEMIGSLILPDDMVVHPKATIRASPGSSIAIGSGCIFEEGCLIEAGNGIQMTIGRGNHFQVI